MAGAYAGEGKTDAKDARIIADTLRLRGDFRSAGTRAELASEFGLLTSYRRDLVADRVRMVNRLRELLPQETRRRTDPHPGRALPGPAARQRAVGDAPRPAPLRQHPAASRHDMMRAPV
jgi:hypothetical protein